MLPAHELECLQKMQVLRRKVSDEVHTKMVPKYRARPNNQLESFRGLSLVQLHQSQWHALRIICPRVYHTFCIPHSRPNICATHRCARTEPLQLQA